MKLKLPPGEGAGAELMWGTKGTERDELRKFVKLLSRMDDRKRGLLLEVAVRMARRNQTKR